MALACETSAGKSLSQCFPCILWQKTLLDQLVFVTLLWHFSLASGDLKFVPSHLVLWQGVVSVSYQESLQTMNWLWVQARSNQDLKLLQGGWLITSSSLQAPNGFAIHTKADNELQINETLEMNEIRDNLISIARKPHLFNPKKISYIY